MSEKNNEHPLGNPQGVQFIAKLFGVTTRRIDQLKTEGIIEGTGKPTKYEPYETIKSYIAFLTDKAYGREKKEKDSDLETQKLEADVRQKKAKAEMTELNLKELKGNMHRAEDVEAIMTEHVLKIKAMLLAIPGRLAVDVSNAKTAQEAAEIIKKEIHYILRDLSEYEYDETEFREKVRERQGWDGEEDE